MSWWQIVILAYLILTPWSEIATIAVVMTAAQERKVRR